jgi:hypothetical protein
MTERSSGFVRLAGVEAGERQRENWASISRPPPTLFSWYSRQFDAADGVIDKFVGRAVFSFACVVSLSLIGDRHADQVDNLGSRDNRREGFQALCRNYLVTASSWFKNHEREVRIWDRVRLNRIITSQVSAFLTTPCGGQLFQPTFWYLFTALTPRHNGCRQR